MSEPKAEKAPQLEVRRAQPGDEHIISSLILEAFEPFKDEYTPGAFDYVTPAASRVLERYDEGPMWIAELHGEPIGTVSGLPEIERYYIRSMAVIPRSQRIGAGQQLLEALERDARERGYARTYLYTTFVLPGATRLYEKNGFSILRETPPEEWFDMGGLEMEKILK